MFVKEKWSINRGVLWLKVGFFLWTLGMYAILPYINLQMASLGLSEEDLGLIWGIMPFFIIPFLPLAGSQLFLQKCTGDPPLVRFHNRIILSYLFSDKRHHLDTVWMSCRQITDQIYKIFRPSTFSIRNTGTVCGIC